MFEKYLITGATGFLGRTVLAQLKDAKAEVRALVMDGDPLAREFSPARNAACPATATSFQDITPPFGIYWIW